MQYETITLTLCIEELVATTDALRTLKNVDALIMLPSIGQKALEHIESVNRLVARISREWGSAAKLCVYA